MTRWVGCMIVTRSMKRSTWPVGSFRRIGSDPSKEAVDGGTMPDPIDEGQTKALVRINGVLRQLGADGSAIVHDVLVHGLTMEKIANKRELGGKTWVEYFGRRFRECLDSMAVYYGLAMPKKIHTMG